MYTTAILFMYTAAILFMYTAAILFMYTAVIFVSHFMKEVTKNDTYFFSDPLP
jgi:hypothetical protein